MGQLVAVTEKPSPRPGVIRFETNRSLTGMGHERFTSMSDAVGRGRPPRCQLLSTGKVDSVYVYGTSSPSMSARVTPPMASAMSCATCTSTGSRRGDSHVRRTRPEPEPAAAAVATAGGASAAESAYTRLVPQSLCERSAAALAKAQAGG